MEGRWNAESYWDLLNFFHFLNVGPASNRSPAQSRLGGMLAAVPGSKKGSCGNSPARWGSPSNKLVMGYVLDTLFARAVFWVCFSTYFLHYL